MIKVLQLDINKCFFFGIQFADVAYDHNWWTVCRKLSKLQKAGEKLPQNQVLLAPCFDKTLTIRLYPTHYLLPVVTIIQISSDNLFLLDGRQGYCV